MSHRESLSKVRRHHTLFTRCSWESSKATLNLRREPSLIVPLDDFTHGALHEEVSTVPLLCHRSANQVWQAYTPKTNILDSVDSLMLTIDKVTTGFRAGKVERELGQLVIYAIELQKPYLSLAP